MELVFVVEESPLRPANEEPERQREHDEQHDALPPLDVSVDVEGDVEKGDDENKRPFLADEPAAGSNRPDGSGDSEHQGQVGDI